MFGYATLLYVPNIASAGSGIGAKTKNNSRRRYEIRKIRIAQGINKAARQVFKGENRQKSDVLHLVP